MDPCLVGVGNRVRNGRVFVLRELTVSPEVKTYIDATMVQRGYRESEKSL